MKEHETLTNHEAMRNIGDPRGPLGPVGLREDTEECRIELAISQLNNFNGHRDADGNTWYGIDDYCRISVIKLLQNYRSLITKQMHDLGE